MPLENGEWTSWNNWSECSEECNAPVTLGTRTRSKVCTNPHYGGMPCTGMAVAPEREECVKCGKKNSIFDYFLNDVPQIGLYRNMRSVFATWAPVP